MLLQCSACISLTGLTAPPPTAGTVVYMYIHVGLVLQLHSFPQRRLELVVILRNDHMTIAHCAISVLQLPCTHSPRNAISYVYTLL